MEREMERDEMEERMRERGRERERERDGGREDKSIPLCILSMLCTNRRHSRVFRMGKSLASKP
jgi:hypothetical protein